MRVSVFFLAIACFCGIAVSAYAEDVVLERIVTSKSYVDSGLSTKLNTADLATEIANAITGKEDSVNKITSLDQADADNVKYPSAMAVKNALDTKVDTSETANQTLNGTYTVAGTLLVPTPTLPE